MFSTQSRLAGRLAQACVLLLVGAIAVLSGSKIYETREAEAWVHHTYEVMASAKGIEIALRDVEAIQRGYLLTGDTAYLDGYDKSRDRIVKLQGDLASQTSTRPLQQVRLRALAPLIQRRLDLAAESIRLRREAGFQAALDVVQSGDDLRLSNRIGGLLDALDAEEDSLLAQREDWLHRVDFWMVRLNTSLALVAFVLLVVAGRLLHRDRRKSAEAAATAAGVARARERQDDRFRRIVESSPNAVLMIDRGGRIAMVNPQTQAMFGYASEELLGQPIECLMPRRFRGAHPDLVARFFAEPKVRAMGAGRDLFAVRKNGEEFRVSIGLAPIETDEGPMVLSTIVDISERVALEAQLRQSQKMEAVGRLTAGIAHDFNNLLQVIMGSLEILQDRVAEERRCTDLICQSIDAAERGSRLTHSLLAFSRTQILRPARIAIAPLVAQSVTLLQRTLGPDVVIDVVDQVEELHAHADAAQLEACILNLAINARDAMPDGGSIVIHGYGATVSQAQAGETLAAGQYVVVAVEDSGCGIDPAIIDKVFEPFFTTKGVGKGSGLGLSMVLGFARQSGGDVRIVSRLGIGTRIEIYLPQVEPATPAETAQSAAKSPEPLAGSILLVDDASDVLVTLGAFLESAGLRVTKAGTPEDALRIVAGPMALDGVVTDFAMPGMSGLHLLSRIAEIRPYLPSLVVSGFPMFAGGGDLPEHTLVLRKPFRRAELMQHVKAMLEQNRTGARTVTTGRPVG